MKHKVVAKSEWTQARVELLKSEKELNAKRDELSRQRRELPWVEVDKSYTFDGPNGKESLADLFNGRRQLITYHFMFGPTWKEGCPGCSLVADNFDGSVAHLASNDVTLVAVSQAAPAKLDAFKARMGWNFKWLSTQASDFSYDFQAAFRPEDRKDGKIFKNYRWRDAEEGASETPGLSIFYKDDEGRIFHTYSTFERGVDMLLATYHYFDLTPLGRNEKSPMSWLRHHDKYEQTKPR